MAAKQSFLGELHEFLAEQMLLEMKWYRDNEIPVPAADKAAVAKFLKDNLITCDPADQADLEKLRNEFQEARKLRQSKALESVKLAESDIEALYG
jgi:hypothetical protein